MQKFIFTLLLLPLLIASCCKDNTQRTCGPNRHLVNDSCMCYPLFYDYDGRRCIRVGMGVTSYAVVDNDCDCFSFPFVFDMFGPEDFIMNTEEKYNFESFNNSGETTHGSDIYGFAMHYNSCCNDTSTVISTMLRFYGDYNQAQDTIRGYFQFERIGHLGPEVTRTCDIVLKRI